MTDFHPSKNFCTLNMGLNRICDLIRQECNPKTKIVSSDTHICLHPHAAEPAYIPSPLLKNKYRKPEREHSQVSIKLFTAATMLTILTMLTFPPTCLLRRPSHPLFCEHKQMNPVLLTLLEFIFFRYNAHVPFFS